MLVENEKFSDLMIEFYFKNCIDNTKEPLKLEFKYLKKFEEDYIKLHNKVIGQKVANK